MLMESLLEGKLQASWYNRSFEIIIKQNLLKSLGEFSNLWTESELRSSRLNRKKKGGIFYKNPETPENNNAEELKDILRR